MPRRPSHALLATLLVLSAPASLGAQAAAVDSDDLAFLRPRPIGPAVTGGRIHDVEALPDDPSTIFAATASGGLWLSTDRGHTWENVFADMPVSTFGDVAIAPSDPRVVYAGTGEQNNRQSTSWGDGVYRSEDGGRTWRHVGLDDTRHIGKVEVDPRNPDVVWVAALGNLWAPSAERGVFRSRDGGLTWDKVLFVDEHTGAVDLVLDPSNPDVVYAATYQRLRRAWGFNGGGPGSGIHKTTDGGATWTELGGGLPAGEKGRIGLAIAATNPRILNALVETADDATTGTFRTTDGGASWTRVNPLNPRPMYYSEIFIDPTDAETVYVVGTSSYVSRNGGRSFTEIAERPTYDVGVHADQHALWIDPTDPEHLYMGGDAGLHESYDRGVKWRKINNFPISQFYAIGVDMRDPYRVYGGLQDNHSFMGPSETRRWIGIVNDDWQQVGFGDGMHWQPSPFDTTIAYGSSNGGSWFRLDTRTGDMIDISPPEPEGESYRFDWTSPARASMHAPDRVIVAGNRVFISEDRGSSWRRTEDLSRRVDRDTLRLMGVAGADIDISRNDGTSSYGEATVIGESPVDPNVLWVGFDDGNLQVTRDLGRSWTEVSGNVAGLPPGTYVSRVVPSTVGAEVAYATFDAHRDGDFRPYVYRTTDMGRSWQPLHAGLPTGSVNALAEHPDDPDVLFLGTEHALFASTDRGATWARVPGIPTTAIDDLVVHPREKDLVVGTHGQGIWIADDTRPLAEWDARIAAEPAHLFSIDDATLFLYWKDTSYRANAEYAGENPPDGALVTYHLGGGSGPATLRVTNASGRVVRELRVPSEPGMHRVNWDLRWSAEDGGAEMWSWFEHPTLARPIDDRGPFVSPGTYTVTLEARGRSVSQTVAVHGDPLLALSLEDYRARERFLLESMELARRIGNAADAATGAEQQRLRRLRFQVLGALRGMSGGGVRQGSLHPPTESMRRVVDDARRAFEGGM